MFKKISTLIEYITSLYKYNLELQKSIESIFRIIKTEKNKNNEYVIDVQVINKASIFRCSVKEIAAQDKLLECFSKTDIRLIAYLATHDLLRPKCKIIALEYDSQKDRTFLQIQNNGSDQLTKLSADKISADSEILNNFSQEDAHRAGYLLAIEQLKLERNAIEKHKTKLTNV